MKQDLSRANKTMKALKIPILIGFSVALFGVLCSLTGVLSSWSHRATDRFFLDQQPHPSILIVAIDNASIQSIGRWPWDRSVHAQVIRKLSNAGAAVIGYDVIFPEPQDAENDNALAAAMIDAGNVVLPIELELKKTVQELTYDTDRILRSISVISNAAYRMGYSNTPPDEDGIVRRIPMIVEDPNGAGVLRAFGYELSTLYNSTLKFDEIPRDRFNQLIIHYPGTPGSTFETVTVSDLLADRVDPSIIKDRVVFVGSTALDLHDHQMVPTSLGTPMAGVEVHASLANTLLTRNWLMPAPTWFTVFLLMFLGLALGIMIPFIRARWSAFILFLLWLAVLIMAFIAFDRGAIVDVVWPTIVLIFTYAGVTLEQRIAAERERRKLKHLFSRYVSPSVVETILEDPSKLNLGGERKRMTVFFSDIRGFTSISERLEPEEIMSVLNTYLKRMTDIVFQYEGVLDKYIGDAVMAFWNAPFDQSDHALRTVKAALTMRAALQEMNDAKVFGENAFRIGMGINTGDMIVGNTGGDVHVDYTVIGDSVNLASRLESLTKEYGVDILTTQATVDELKGKILVRKLDKVAVKGRREPVTIYEVIDFMDRVTVEQKQAVRDFEDALNAYFNKRFDEALEKCQAHLEKHSNDKPTQLLCERSDAFKDHPPTDDWDGRWVFTKK